MKQGTAVVLIGIGLLTFFFIFKIATGVGEVVNTVTNQLEVHHEAGITVSYYNEFEQGVMAMDYGSMLVGDKLPLKVMFSGMGEQQLKYTSANPTICTVDAAGKLTAQNAGQTTIDVVTADGKYRSSFAVDVFKKVDQVTAPKSIQMKLGDIVKPDVKTVPAGGDVIWYVYSGDVEVTADGSIVAKKEGVAILNVVYGYSFQDHVTQGISLPPGDHRYLATFTVVVTK